MGNVTPSDVRTLALGAVLSLSVLTAGGIVAGTHAFDRESGARVATAREHQPFDPGDQDERVTFAPTAFRDIAGQVAIEDGDVAVRGIATGTDEVLVAMLDRRGRLASEIVSVDDDGTFEEDVALVTARGESLSKGSIAATVYSPGRDGQVGDGEMAGFTRADLAALDERTREKILQARADRTPRTRAQIQAFMFEQTVNDSGSDDLALQDRFTYTDGRTSIETVVPGSRANQTGVHPVEVGETLVIRGLTNRKPDDNAITVEAVDGPIPEAFDVPATDQWGTDGVWSVELDARDVEPGTYVFEADDGDDSDRVEVRVLSRESEDATANTGERRSRNQPRPGLIRR